MPLVNGGETMVSDAMYEELRERTWVRTGNHGAGRYVQDSGTHEYLHRRVAGPAADEDVHHLNGDTMDNRAENLVSLSRAEHAALHARLRRTESGQLALPGGEDV